MSLSSFAECRTYQFSYKNQEALYIDHHGERVLADVEGWGSFSISNLPEKATIWVDGVPAEPTIGAFSESVLITSTHPGSSAISVQRGLPPPIVGPCIEAEKFEGCGWIVGSESICSIDGIIDGWEDMAQRLPVPVLIGAVGKGLRIQVVDGVFKELFELDMSRPSDLAGRKWEVKNASKLFDLRSELPGFGLVDCQVLSHLNQSSFEVLKPAGCRAVLIRKLYDAFHGRQRARLLVNGQFRDWWYEPIEDRSSRWRWGHIGFSTSEEAEDLHVTLDPPAGAPLWSVSKYQVLGLFPLG